jgi:hypothetical protein
MDDHEIPDDPIDELVRITADAQAQQRRQKANETATEAGFPLVTWRDMYGVECSVEQSTIIVEDPDSEEDPSPLEMPGSSALWLGTVTGKMHLNRGQVRDLMKYLQRWLESGELYPGTRNPTRSA